MTRDELACITCNVRGICGDKGNPLEERAICVTELHAADRVLAYFGITGDKLAALENGTGRVAVVKIETKIPHWELMVSGQDLKVESCTKPDLSNFVQEVK